MRVVRKDDRREGVGEVRAVGREKRSQGRRVKAVWRGESSET